MSADEANIPKSSTNCCDSKLQYPVIIKTEGNYDSKVTCGSLSASTIMEQWSKQSDIKWFSCDICDYKSAYSTDLKAHIRIHTGEKPYKCDVCDYRSAHPSSLKKHSRKHTGEKPYVCKVCSLSFSQRTNMKRHEETHTGNKKYKCDICHNTYAQLKALKVHYRKHTGEKPYKCSECEYCTAHPGALKTHKQTHSRAKPLNQSFTHPSDLKEHEIKIHENKPIKLEIKEEISIGWDDSTTGCKDSQSSVNGFVTEIKIEPGL